MNVTRLALAALAGFVTYFVVGGIYFAVPAMRTEFAKYPGVFRSGEAINSVMAIGMFGILLAIAAATTLFARIHPAGAGWKAGLVFGATLAVFQLGAFVLHNYMNLNIGAGLTLVQGIVYSTEWLAVGVVISLIYRG